MATGLACTAAGVGEKAAAVSAVVASATTTRFIESLRGLTVKIGLRCWPERPQQPVGPPRSIGPGRRPGHRQPFLVHGMGLRGISEHVPFAIVRPGLLNPHLLV